jgi:hypothetical protein
MEVPQVDGKVAYREEGRKRKEPTTAGGVGWNPREPGGVPNGKLLENTEGAVRKNDYLKPLEYLEIGKG